MRTTLIVLLALLGKTPVWTESALVKIFPDSGPSAAATDAVRLYAARGEREGFQIGIQARRRPVVGVHVIAEALDKEIGVPEVRRIGYLKVDPTTAQRKGDHALWPDPLLDMSVFDVAQGQTRALWIRYDVPRDAKAGVHAGRVQVLFNRSVRIEIPVTIEVFDFELPEVSSLNTLFSLDRSAIRSFYGITDNSLDRWKPSYDAVIQEHLGFSLWTEPSLVPVSPDGVADTATFKEHLDYVIAQRHMKTIDVGLGAQGAMLFPPPMPSSAPDPLAFYLQDMGDWLQDRGWLDHAFMEAAPFSGRDHWPEIRAAYQRLQQADPRIRGLFSGPLHPYFEKYTDIWSVRYSEFDPYAVRRLQQGLSLAGRVDPPAVRVSASSCGSVQGYTSSPEDAYDACPFTVWCSAHPPVAKEPEWLQLEFSKPVDVKQIAVVWQPGMEAGDIRVDTSFDGRRFVEASSRWEEQRPPGPYQPGWSEGNLNIQKSTWALRLRFLSTSQNNAVGVREVRLGTPQAPQAENQVQAPETWLALSEDSFPACTADKLPAEVRLIPWVCWDLGFAGFSYPHLNTWPGEWEATFAGSPEEWSGGGNGADFLFYPGPQAPIPSLRAEALRDGMEDVEYLVLLEKASREGRTFSPEVARALQHRLLPLNPSSKTVQAWLADNLKRRVQIGRELTRLNKVRK